MKEFYASPPIDEVAFLEAVKSAKGGAFSELASFDELIALTKSKGIDHAAAHFYLSILENPTYRPFIDRIDAQPVKAWDTPAGAKVLLVPAMFYKEHPEVGGGGDHALAVARACGFEAERIETGSIDTVLGNAELIVQALERQTQPVWIMTLSRGALEFRMALERYAKRIPPGRVLGWINICGFPTGCYLVERMNADWKSRIKLRLIARAIKSTYPKVLQMSPSFCAPTDPFVPPKGLRIINVVPVPLSSHVQTSLVGRFKYLRRYGPNDGMTAIAKSPVLPGEIYPMWACDHFFRADKVIPFMYRLFGYLRQK